MKTFSKIVFMLAVSASFIFVSSCGKYDDGPKISLRSKKARLTGDWELKKIDGDKIKSEIIYTFEKDGNFDVDRESGHNSDGDWEWDNGKEVIELDFDGGGKYDFEVKRLTNKELWWDDEDGDEWIFEKQK